MAPTDAHLGALAPQHSARIAQIRSLLDDAEESLATPVLKQEMAAILRELDDLLRLARRSRARDAVVDVMLLSARALIRLGTQKSGEDKLDVLERRVTRMIRVSGGDSAAVDRLGELLHEIAIRRWSAQRDRHGGALDSVSKCLDQPPALDSERLLDAAFHGSLPEADRWGRDNGHPSTVARARLLKGRIHIRRNSGPKALEQLNILRRWLGLLLRDPSTPGDQLEALFEIRGQTHVWRAMAYRAMLDEKRALGCLMAARAAGVKGTARAWMLVAEAEIGLSLGIMSRQDAAARLTEARVIAAAEGDEVLAERTRAASWPLQTPRRSATKASAVELLASISAWARASALEMRDMPLIEQDLEALPDAYLARAVERINQVGQDVARLSLDVSADVLEQAMYYSRINAVLREVAHRVGRGNVLAALDQAERARAWGLRSAYTWEAMVVPSAPEPNDLPADTVLLEYVWSSKPAVIACDSRRAVQYDLPCTRKALTSAVDELLDLVTRNTPRSDPTLRKVLRQVYAMLIEPVEALAENARHLIISPDGELLWQLPFALLLREDDRHMIQEWAIRYCWSAASALQDLNKPGPPAGSMALMLPLPFHSGGGQIAREVWNRRNPGDSLRSSEVSEGGGTGDMGYAWEDATMANWYGLPGDATDLFFIGHVRPSTSGPFGDLLCLHDGGVAIAGDTQSMRSWQLAVLCGCRTAGNVVFGGEGAVGLAYGAARAGTRAIVASCWPIDFASGENSAQIAPEWGNMLSLFYRTYRTLRARPGRNSEPTIAAALALQHAQTAAIAHNCLPVTWGAAAVYCGRKMPVGDSHTQSAAGTGHPPGAHTGAGRGIAPGILGRR